jgi:hypothetical protein
MIGSPSSPISILILSALRYLGRSWTLDDLQEATCISEEVICVFLHRFLDYGSTVLYERWVTSPTLYGEARTHIKEYEMAGFPGAVGSTDATHVLLERVSNRNRQAHLGFKSSHTARAYNITVNHRRQILSTTSGHPARWNDKTLQLFDPFMEQLHQGKILDDHVFQLYSLDAAGNVVKKSTKVAGCWLITATSADQQQYLLLKQATADLRSAFWHGSNHYARTLSVPSGFLKGVGES